MVRMDDMSKDEMGAGTIYFNEDDISIMVHFSSLSKNAAATLRKDLCVDLV